MITRIDHIEMYVGNIYQAAFFYKSALNFSEIQSYGIRDNSVKEAKNILKHQDITLVLSSASHAEHDIYQHIAEHGDSIKDVAFIVDDVDQVFQQAMNYGAKQVIEPCEILQNSKRWRIAKISTFGSVIHSLIQCLDGNEHNFFTQKSAALLDKNEKKETLFSELDHIAICVGLGELDKWIKFYTEVFGLKQVHEESIDTGNSGMNSIVLSSLNGVVKIVFTEPMEQYKNSQIQEFIDHNKGNGVQHLAFKTEDIVHAVKELISKDIVFLKVPKTYYELRLEAIPEAKEKIHLFSSLNILIDKDEDGYLYQIFSKPIGTRPTLFFEVIQREGCNGFGSENIKALFKAIEMEQKNCGSI